MKLCRIQGHTFISSALSKNSAILDLGANQGAFAVEITRRFGCEVHAVEPTPQLACGLRRLKQIITYDAAVSASGEDLFFKMDPHNSESSALAKEADSDVIRVAGITLNSLLTKIGRVDLIKIDVEGSEIEILLGASEDLVRQVAQITVEFHDFKTDSGFTVKSYERVCERMKKIGFNQFVMSYRTKGDVLFLNKSVFPLRVFDKFLLEMNGRWVPGILRVTKRLF